MAGHMLLTCQAVSMIHTDLPLGRGDVSFERLIERYKTDVLLHMVVNINTDYTAGRGFHLSVKDDSGKSQHALKLIEGLGRRGRP